MKNLLLLLTLCVTIHGVGHTQTIYRDTLINKSACLVSLTDSASQLYELPLKMHIDITDYGDSTSGAVFNYTFYTMSNAPVLINAGTIGISGSYYTAWNANSDTYPYTFCADGLLTKNIIITFK